MKIDLRTAAYASIVLGALSLAACKSKGETAPDAPPASSGTPSSAPADATTAPPPTSGDGG